MGSSKRSDSNLSGKAGRGWRRRVSHERPGDPAVVLPSASPEQTESAEQAKEPPDVDAIMGRLSDAISVVATAANALVGSQEREGSSSGADVGDEITTLVHGIQCVRKAYDELDVAVREVQS